MAILHHTYSDTNRSSRFKEKGDNVRERLVEFAVAVMDLCVQLPNTMACTQIAEQLLRRVISAASNYAGARGAESVRDFVHKLGIVFKELNEFEGWIDQRGLFGARNRT